MQTFDGFLGDEMLADEVVTETLENFDLLLRGESGDDGFEDGADAGGIVDGDEGGVVHVGEETHDELAVHAVWFGVSNCTRWRVMEGMVPVMPPWPGTRSPKSLILKVLLSPLAKKPPNGAMREAKVAITRMWNCIGSILSTGPKTG